MGCANSVPIDEEQQRKTGPAAPAHRVPAPAPASSVPSTAIVVSHARPVVAAISVPSEPAAAAKPAKTGPQGAARYEVAPGILGKGHFAVVKKCRDVVTGIQYAVKIIDKKEIVKSSASVVRQEIEILIAVGAHPNIVQLIDHYEDATKYYLVMEYAGGGDLFGQIVEHGKYSELEAIRCCRQLAGALQHIHSCGITHRDLKPENILLVAATPTSPLKLADFGLSKLIKGHLHPMRTVCGTWAYCVADDTMLSCWIPSLDAAGCETPKGAYGTIVARDVTTSTMLVSELHQPIEVKAIHTNAQSYEPLWTVCDDAGETVMRCTADHKLSFIETALQRRVEIRCEDYAKLNRIDQQRYQAYTASIDASSSPSSSIVDSSSLQHIGRLFSITVLAPLPCAVPSLYVGIEVCSPTHRYVLSSGLVTSNCAPEVIQRQPYDASVDNWTLGVLMYILLSGYHPFDVFGDCPEPELLQKIISCDYDFDDPVWTNVSESAKHLIRGLLVLSPKERMTLDQYLESPWITQGQAKAVVAPKAETKVETKPIAAETSVDLHLNGATSASATSTATSSLYDPSSKQRDAERRSGEFDSIANQHTSTHKTDVHSNNNITLAAAAVYDGQVA